MVLSIDGSKCTQKYQLRKSAVPSYMISIFANKLVKIGGWRFFRGQRQRDYVGSLKGL